MTPISTNRVLLGVMLSVLVTAIGCTGKNSLSSYARPGDTVMVSFGAVSDSPALRQEDLLAQVTDSAGSTRTAKIRSVINVYPDPASHFAAETGGGTLSYTGLRSAVIDLVDGSGNALSLAQGTANLKLTRISTNALVASNIKIQILSGVGTPHPFTEQVAGLNYTASLSARPQVRYRIKPVSTAYNQTLSAIEFELHYNPSALTGQPETSWPQAVPTMADANVQFSARYYQQGADEVIKVMMVNPDGIIRIIARTPVVVENFYRGMSSYDTLAFSVVWGDGTLQTSYPTPTFDGSIIANATPVLRVFDIAGNDVTSNFTIGQE